MQPGLVFRLGLLCNQMREGNARDSQIAAWGEALQRLLPALLRACNTCNAVFLISASSSRHTDITCTPASRWEQVEGGDWQEPVSAGSSYSSSRRWKAFFQGLDDVLLLASQQLKGDVAVLPELQLQLLPQLLPVQGWFGARLKGDAHLGVLEWLREAACAQQGPMADGREQLRAALYKAALFYLQVRGCGLLPWRCHAAAPCCLSLPWAL